MLEGMDFISGLIVQYAVVEQLYASGDSELSFQLQQSVIGLYVSILEYLVHSVKYFGYNKFKRALSGINQSMTGEVSQLQKKIDDAKSRVDADASLVHHDLTQNGIDVLAREQKSLVGQGDKVLEGQARIEAQQGQMLAAQKYQGDRTRILAEILEKWQRPLQLVSDRILDVHKEADYARTTRISNWLSDIHVDAQHMAIRDGRLPSSGEWLLRHPIYRGWVESLRSSVLWMHGLLGTGKTNLTSVVIDSFNAEIRKQHDSPRLAYFYCTRNKVGSGNAMDSPLGSEPVKIFRSLLKQLSKAGKTNKFDITVTDKYHQLKVDLDEPRQLTLSECVELISSISSNRPTAIIIDALDECRSTKAHDLVQGLDEIVVRSPKNVKVFLSTRPVSTVIDCLRDKQYMSLEVNAHRNNGDITEFIKHELDKRISEKQLLHGYVPDELRSDLLFNLSERAGSMFWYASLQLNLLCDPTAEQSEESIRMKLTELPATLKEVYTGVLDEIASPKNSERSRDVAQNTLKWLLCAQEPLTQGPLLEAISVIAGGVLKPEKVSSICRSLVYLDKDNDRFEFAHLSVREHLEGEEKYAPSECHLIAAESCLKALQTFSMSNAVSRAVPDSAKAFSRYAFIYWPFHFQKIDFRRTDDRKERLKNKLRTLLVRVRDVSPIFNQWISYVETMVDGAGASDERLLKMETLKAVPATPLFAASVFGFADLIAQFRRISGYDLEQRNIHKQTALCLAVENDQLETVKAFLEELPRSKVPPLDVNQVNLCAVEQFLGFDHSSPPKVICYAFALQAAALKGNVSIAKYLLQKGARVDLVAGFYGNSLQAAAFGGHSELVDFFLDYGAEPNSQGGYYGNALQAAAASGDLATVSTLIEYGAVVPMPGGHFGTALMAAVDSRNRDVVELLLYNKAEINKISETYGTPLQRAADLDSFDIVELLVTEGAEMNIQSSAETHPDRVTHRSALATAAWGRHPKIVSILLKNGAQADLSHHGKELHLLHQAALTGMIDLAEYCIDGRGCDVNIMTDQSPNYVSKGNMTPLSYACSHGQLQMVLFLLRKGALLEFDNDDHTTLWLAARRGHFAVLQALLKASAAREAVDDHSKYVNRQAPDTANTALQEALAVGPLECVELLLLHGANFQPNLRGDNPIHSAIKYHRLHIVKALVNHSRSAHFEDKDTVNARDGNGLTPLLRAVWENHLEMVEMLLASGVNMAICELRENNSVLHFAAILNRAQIVRELFRNRDRVRNQLGWRNSAGFTPLVKAVRNRSFEAAGVLLEEGARWPLDSNPSNSLHEAVMNGENLVVRLCLETFQYYPAELQSFLESPDNDGKTALHVAAEVGNHESLELLLQYGSRRGATDAELWTPLMFAIVNGHDSCARTLLDFTDGSGYQVTQFIDARNSSSRTALHEAVLYRRGMAISLLMAHGSDFNICTQENETVLYLAVESSQSGEDDEDDDDGRVVYSMVTEILRMIQVDEDRRRLINWRTNTENTVLLQACEQNMVRIAGLLLDCGADCFLLDHKSCSPLHSAAYHGSTKFAELMLDKLLEDCDTEKVQDFINQRNINGMTALNDACRANQSNMVELLLRKYKADYTIAGNKTGLFSEITPLHSAVWTEDVPLVQKLLEHVMQDRNTEKRQSLLDAYHSKGAQRRTALIEAVIIHHAEIAKLLLAAGADYALVDEDQCTALHWSILQNNEAVTSTLLESTSIGKEDRRKEFLNCRNGFGKTALMEAAELNLAPMIEMLLKCPETDYTVQDTKGFTALHYSAYQDKRAAANFLLYKTSQDRTDNGAKFVAFINHRAHQNGVSALFDAAGAGHAEMSRILLNFGADCCTFDDAGHHPLHFAVKKDYFDVVEAYLEFAYYRANGKIFVEIVTAKDPDSKLTIMEIAERKGSSKMKAILSKYIHS